MLIFGFLSSKKSPNGLGGRKNRDRHVEYKEFGKCLTIVRSGVESPEEAITIGDAIGLIHDEGAESKIDASNSVFVAFKTDLCVSSRWCVVDSLNTTRRR